MKNRFKNKLNKSNLVFGAVVTLASSAFVLLVGMYAVGGVCMKKMSKSKLKGLDIVTHINKTIEEYGPIKSVLVTTGTIGIAGCGYVALSLGIPNKLENLVKTIETEAV